MTIKAKGPMNGEGVLYPPVGYQCFKVTRNKRIPFKNVFFRFIFNIFYSKHNHNNKNKEELFKVANIRFNTQYYLQSLGKVVTILAKVSTIISSHALTNARFNDSTVWGFIHAFSSRIL